MSKEQNLEDKDKALHIGSVSKRFLSDIRNLEHDLLLTINGSVLEKYTKKEVEQRLSNTLKQLEKLKNFNVC